MPLEIACLGYAGLASLARGSQRHRHIAARGPLTSPRLAKVTGWALLAVSCIAAFIRFGQFQGGVAWLGLLSLSGLVLVLAMSRWPDRALRAWLPAMLLAVPLALSAWL
ncbi:MAG: DUF3325 family protein [Pseudomonadota bacterium]|jgi:hypothetical protein